MTLNALVPILALIVSGIMMIFAILTFARNGAKDNKEEERKSEEKMDSIKESLLKANMKLDQVCATTNETRSDIKSMSNDISSLDRRLTVVERDVKTAFHQIEELKNNQ